MDRGEFALAMCWSRLSLEQGLNWRETGLRYVVINKFYRVEHMLFRLLYATYILAMHPDLDRRNKDQSGEA